MMTNRFDRFSNNLKESMGVSRPARSEFSCPMCRCVVNALLPLSPELGQERLRLSSSSHLIGRCEQIAKCVGQIIVNEQVGLS